MSGETLKERSEKMPYYRILGEPMENSVPNYRGVYRQDPFPSENSSKKFIELWSKYSEAVYNGKNIELEELKQLLYIASKEGKQQYQLICFSESDISPDEYCCYGYDVIGNGGYSILGEGLFNTKSDSAVANNILKVINKYFETKLNEYGLFDSRADAEELLSILMETNNIIPNAIEKENWHVVRIFCAECQ